MNKENNLVILKRLTKSFTTLMLFFFFSSFYFYASAGCYSGYDFCACCEGTPDCDTLGETCTDVPSLNYCAGHPNSSEGGAVGVYITPYGYYVACESICSPGSMGKVAHEYCCTTPCGSTDPTPCIPVNGGWCGYGACQSDGYQYRTCNCPAPSCGGASCSGTNKRECARLTGITWDDEVNNNLIDSDEDWTDDSASACSSKLYIDKNFRLGYGSSTQIIDDWRCNIWKTLPSSSMFSYYRTDKVIPAVDSSTVSLDKDRMPEGYWCDTWEFYRGDDILSASLNLSGAGCTATIAAKSPPTLNILNWKLREAGGLKGIIWHEKNWDGTINTNEDWRGSTASSVCSSMINDFQVTDSLGINVINEWVCKDWNSSAYQFWTAKPKLYTGSQSFTLENLPTGYACDSWEFFNDGSSPETLISSGSGCVATVDISKGNVNTLNYKMKQVGRLTGYIWSDDRSYVGDRAPGEDWYGGDQSVSSVGDCWNRYSPFEILHNSKPGNIITKWSCDATETTLSTYRTSYVDVGSEVSFTLSGVPEGFECDNWRFRKLDSSGNYYRAETGVGCTASVQITNDTGGNYLIWQIKPAQVYFIDVTVKQLPDGDNDCLSLSDKTNLSGVVVKAYENVNPYTKLLDTSEPSDSNGKVRLQIPLIYKDIRLSVDGYDLVCPTPPTFQYPTVVDKETVEAMIGVRAYSDVAWISSIDADIYAGSVLVTPPDTDSDDPFGFQNYLINSLDDGSGGYVYSANEITTINGASEKGGYAVNLNPANGPVSHESAWLNTFSFKSPIANDEVEGIPSGLTFTDGKVYSSTCSEYNASDLSLGGTYSVSDGGVAILYVEKDSNEECDTIKINGNIVSTGGRLVVISEPGINVLPEVGGVYVSNQNPNIMVSFISNETINFQSTSIGDDIPVMMTAPLVTTGNIYFQRDLGAGNTDAPAESVLAYPKYLYQISSLEREKSLDFLYYTGLTTYDLEWEYIY